jgi:5-methylcytosine-specific restriction endonuclease McrA
MVKMLKPFGMGKERPIAAIPPKRADAYYFSREWKNERVKVFERDGYICTVPGCGQPAKVADHIHTRRFGGSDSHKNLRSLCQYHDHVFKERPDGSRKNSG